MKIAVILLLAAAFMIPLSGGVFAPEWNFEGKAADKGNISSITEHFREGDVVHIFDGAGRKIKRTYPDKKTKQQIEFRMFYNADNKLEKVECYADGKLIYFEKGSYYDGLLRALVRYDAGGREDFWTTMINYDQKSSKIKSFGVQTATGRIDYFYDRNQKGEAIFIRAFIKNRLNTAARYTFDRHGLITAVKGFDTNMKEVGIIINEWKVDEHGNWIEKKSYIGKNTKSKKILMEVVKRSIKYKK